MWIQLKAIHSKVPWQHELHQGIIHFHATAGPYFADGLCVHTHSYTVRSLQCAWTRYVACAFFVEHSGGRDDRALMLTDTSGSVIDQRNTSIYPLSVSQALTLWPGALSESYYTNYTRRATKWRSHFIPFSFTDHLTKPLFIWEKKKSIWLKRHLINGKN